MGTNGTHKRQPRGPPAEHNGGFSNGAAAGGGVTLGNAQRRFTASGICMEPLREDSEEANYYSPNPLDNSLLNTPRTHRTITAKEVPPYCTPSRASNTTVITHLTDMSNASSPSPPVGTPQKNVLKACANGRPLDVKNLTPTRAPSRGPGSTNWRRDAGPGNVNVTFRSGYHQTGWQQPGQQVLSQQSSPDIGIMQSPLSNRHQRSASHLSQQSAPGMTFGQMPGKMTAPKFNLNIFDSNEAQLGVQSGRASSAASSSADSATPFAIDRFLKQTPGNGNPGKTIIVAEEIKKGSRPEHPLFLEFIPYKERQIYVSVVLPIIANSVFVIASPVDMNWFQAMLQSQYLPDVANYITRIEFPGFFWFSGIALNIKRNPYFALLDNLPSVMELSLTFHTAGLTVSEWTERQRVQYENQGHFEKSKQLKVLRSTDVVNKYGLQDVFEIPNLQLLKLECLKSPMVSQYARAADTTSPFKDLAHWFRQGYSDQRGRDIKIMTKVTDITK